ncbi:MAG: type VI secretion system ATPase TssH [Succinatimonas sp.]|nr:type VI secretion system ATPase TssH [Succinatimonas sp.]
MKLKRVSLFKRLNKECYKALESATVLAKTRGNPYVELCHVINQILLTPNSDLHQIIKNFQIDESKLAKDLIESMDSLPRGASSIEDFAVEIEQMIKDAWMVCSLMYSDSAIRSGHLILALKQNFDLSRKLHSISSEFKKINADILEDNFVNIVKNSDEVSVKADSSQAASGQAGQMMSDPAMGKGEALSLYCQDLTQKALDGKIDNIVGRDEEIRKITDILLRRRQNNPILTGEAGVGKTAVVEGFACRLAHGDVPDCLKGTKLLSLDIGLLQAGASMKGEFENRLKQVIEEVQHSDTPIILFIDEAHTLVGAGGAAGQNDAANLLKPALARGQLRCIAATTWKEYVKYFEKDPALTRRFEKILVDEPDDDKAVQMLRGMVGVLEKYHHVTILDNALDAAVKLSRRYIPTRQLPDKAVSIIDTACAKVALSQNAEPYAVEYLRRKLEALNTEKDILTKEDNCGFDEKERLAELDTLIAKVTEQLNDKSKLLDDIKAQAKIYIDLREKIKSQESPDTLDEDKKTLKSERDKLNTMQGEDPMFLPEVDEQAVATVISEWTGIPLGKMVKDEIKSVLSLGEIMKQRVIGQDHGLELIAKRITTARAQLGDPNKPIAVIMLAGPSGVGKTETALTLAETLYGSEQNLITINMSEFQEAHTVSTLKGAPPGYVGYGEGGVLTEAVRRKPYSVVLLDEVEKAHKDVHELFFQVFDKGNMEDGEGRQINFKNTVILLTTNAGDNEIMEMCKDENNLPDVKTLEEACRPALYKIFPAALIGRMSIVPYYPLSHESLNHIIDLKLSKVVKRVKENYGATFTFTQQVRDEIISRCNNIASGARMIDAIISNDLLPEISSKFLEKTMDNRKILSVTVDSKDGEFIYNFEDVEAE